jgi:hypothetical protein
MSDGIGEGEEGMTERRQDMWRVIVNFKNENRKTLFEPRIEGVVDLCRPMVALDAADYALRAVVQTVHPPLVHISVDIWGRADIGSDPVRLCSAVAEHVSGLGKYLRYTPWGVGSGHEDIGDPEGAAIIAFA